MMNKHDPKHPGPNGRQIRIPVRRGGILPPPERAASPLLPKQSSSPEPSPAETEAEDITPLSSEPDTMPQNEEAIWKQRYLRLQADLDNMKRRLQKRLEIEAAEEQQALLLDLLPLADHLQAALTHSAADSDPDHLRQGIELTLRAFLETLRRYGVEPIDALGKPFDPRYHEAVGQVRTSRVPSGHVAQVMQNGYTHDGKLLRPARVLVAAS